MADKQVLVLVAHPRMKSSRVNSAMKGALTSLANVTVHDLYEAYPDFRIDVKREQSLLEKHDVIVMQFPFYWYSCPPLLKQWEDDVLEFGYAYGPGGNKLKGKHLQLALTAGGPQDAYQAGGYNQFTISELLRPFQQTANLCQMAYRSPFVLHSSNNAGTSEVSAHAKSYRELISTLAGPAT